MVNVRVTQDHGLQRANFEWERAVALDGFTALTLEQSALQQDSGSIDLEQIHRACRRAGRPKKMDPHDASTVAVGDTGFAQIVRGDFHVDAIADADADEILAHLPRNMGEHFMAIGQRNTEHRAGKHLRDGASQCNGLFLCHGDLAGFDNALGRVYGRPAGETKAAGREPFVNQSTNDLPVACFCECQHNLQEI